MSKQKKQSFLGGAAILAAAVAIVKGIGFFYKIPLNNTLDRVGKTYFDVAYQIYNVLLSVSTAGFPLALSKLVSEAQAKGRENQKKRLFWVALWLFLALGLMGSAFMLFGTRVITGMLHNEGAYSAIRALAPAVFFVCVLSCIRGYTQGQGNMTPSAASQVLEAVCKLGIGDDQVGQVGHHGPGAQHGGGGQELSQVVEDSGHRAGQPDLFFREGLAQQAQDTPAEQSPGGAVDEGRRLSGEHRPQKYPPGQHQQGVPRAQDEHGVHRDDVGQPQLDPGNGGQGGDLRLRHKDGQGDGGEQGQPGDPPRPLNRPRHPAHLRPP